MMPDSIRMPRWVLIAVAVIVVAAIGWIYFSFDPSTHYYPRCLFHEFTGWQCPGCGSQRALHALLTGDIRGAWEFNALFVLELPLMALLVVAWQLRGRYPGLHRALNTRTVILVILTVIILWTIVRNII